MTITDVYAGCIKISDIYSVSDILLEYVKEGRKEMFYLTMHSTHFNYAYMASDIWYWTTKIVRGNLLPPQGNSYQLAARDLLHAPSHRQNSTYHGFCYTSCAALAEQETTQWVHHEGSIP